jgi:L-methionine (R)-S-oxide reductase
MMPVLTHEQLLSELEAEARFAPTVETLMQKVVTGLRDNLPAYNWVGFYMIEETPGQERMLVLGPFVGADTPHKRIPLNQGICGAAVSTGETVIVDDVNSDPRYLACSIETKSEIVAPVSVNGRIVGELDIDSHQPAAFRGDDQKLVEACAALVGRYMERTRA